MAGITVNEGGAQYELQEVWVNEGGELYSPDVVTENENGSLYEVFMRSKGYRDKITFDEDDLGSGTYEWNEDETAITFTSAYQISKYSATHSTFMDSIVITLTEETVVSFEVKHKYNDADYYGRMTATVPEYQFADTVTRTSITSPAIATTGSADGVSYGTPSSVCLTLGAGTYNITCSYIAGDGTPSSNYVEGYGSLIITFGETANTSL